MPVQPLRSSRATCFAGDLGAALRLLGGLASEFDRGAEFMSASIAGPRVMDYTFANKLRMLRCKLVFATLRAAGTGEVAGESGDNGRRTL
jgi:hypothetical protein